MDELIPTGGTAVPYLLRAQDRELLVVRTTEGKFNLSTKEGKVVQRDYVPDLKKLSPVRQ